MARRWLRLPGSKHRFATGVGVALAVFLGICLLPSWLNPEAEFAGRATLILAALAIAMSGWLVPRRPNIGRRMLIGLGSAVIAFIIVTRLLSTQPAPVWPIVLAGAASLYLWWLGILLFDLTFIWHRYIRRSVAIHTLAQWTHRKDAQPNPKMGLCSPPGMPKASPPGARP